MFGDVTFIWTVIISQLISKVLITDAHYSDYEVARMPQYDYEGASPKAPVHLAEVGDEYHEPQPGVSQMANIDYIEEIPDTRKNKHKRKDLDTEYTWPLRNPRRQQRPIENEEQFDDEIIPKVKLNYRNINTNSKYKLKGGTRHKNDDSQSKRNRYSRKWNQSNRKTEELDEAPVDEDKPEIDTELTYQETTKGRRRKPRDKSMAVKRSDDYQYDGAEHEFRKQMNKIRGESMLGEPPGLVPGPDDVPTRRPMRTRYATRTAGDTDVENTEKDFDYYDMKRLKKERGRVEQSTSTTTTTTTLPTSSMVVEKQLSAALNNRQVRSDDLALPRVSTTRLGPKILILTTRLPVITLPDESIDYGFETEWTNFIKTNNSRGLRYVFWMYAFCTFLALVQPIRI